MFKKIGCFQIFLIIVLLFLLDQFFTNYLHEVAIVLSIIFGVVLLFFIIKQIREYKGVQKHQKLVNKNMQQVAEVSDIQIENHISPRKPQILTNHNYQADEDSLLPNSELGYLTNILLDIRDIKNQTLSEVEELNASGEIEALRKEYNNAILYDISQIPMHLNFDIHDCPAERNILLAAFGFFKLNETEFDQLVSYKIGFEHIFKEFLGKMNSPMAYNYEEAIVGMQTFRNYKKSYLSGLTEIVKLVSNMDYEITKVEKKGTRFYTNYKI
jgi:hypothetical protein